MAKLVIFGSRSYQFDTCERNAMMIDSIAWTLGIRDKPTILSGTARGADRAGEDYAKHRGLECVRFPADWDRYGKRAGIIRNERMAKEATHAIAFWDGKSRGTKHMISECYRLQIPIIVVHYADEPMKIEGKIRYDGNDQRGTSQDQENFDDIL